MPTVPRVTQSRVSTQALPGVRQQGSQHPPPLDLSQPARLLGAIYEQERDRADQSVYRDAEAKAARLQVDLQVELQKVGGRDAAAIPDRLKESWQKGTDEIRKGLTNPRQKAAVENALSQRFSQLYGVAQTHMARETEKYDAATLDESLTRSTDLAVLNAGDSEVVGTEMAKMENAIRAYADTNRSKLPDGWADARVADAFSKTHTGVIARMLDSGEDRSAKSYFELVKGEISGADIGKVERALDVGSTLGESQRQADRILALNLTEGESYEQAKQLTDPEIRKATGQQLDVEFSRRDRARSAQRTDDLETAYTAVLEHGTLPPTSVLARLPVTDRANVIAFFKKAQKGEPVETNQREFYDLTLMAANDPEKFKKLNLWSKRHLLDESDFKQTVRTQAALLKGSDDPEVRGPLREAQVMDARISTSGLFKSKPKADSDDEKRLDQVRLSINADITDFKEATGKKVVPPEELERIIDRNLIKVRFGGKEIAAGALLPSDVGTVTVAVEDIPADERMSLEDQFINAGKRWTNDQLARAYAAVLRGNREAVIAIIRER